MKKLLLLLAVMVAFTCTSAAQYGMEQSAGGKSKSEMDAGKAMKDATLTGCVSKEADAGGNYMLSNAKHKKGVALEPAEKVKEHAGHQVEVMGKWSADKSKFEVASLKHISATCEEAGGGAAKKGKKDKAMSEKPPK